MSNPEYSIFAHATSTYDVTDKDINNDVYNNLSPQNQSQSKYNQILDETALKRACCNRPNDRSPKTVKVRIPSWPGYQYSSLEADQIAKENNYVDVDVNLQQECPAGYNNQTTTQCKDFYRIYCGNILDEFSKRYWRDKSKPFPYEQWILYKKECACFAPDPKWVQAMNFNTLPKCVIPECRQGSGAFLDSISQSGECQDLTYCSQDFSAGTIAAIENSTVELAVNMINNCGPGSEAQTTLQDQVQPGSTPQPVSASQTPSSTPAPVPPSSSQPSLTQPSPTQPSSTQTPNTQSDQQSTTTTNNLLSTNRLIPIGGVTLLICIILIVLIGIGILLFI